MMTFLMAMISNAPTGGPIWFGVMADIFATISVVTAIYCHRKELDR